MKNSEKRTLEEEARSVADRYVRALSEAEEHRQELLKYVEIAHASQLPAEAISAGMDKHELRLANLLRSYGIPYPPVAAPTSLQIAQGVATARAIDRDTTGLAVQSAMIRTALGPIAREQYSTAQLYLGVFRGSKPLSVLRLLLAAMEKKKPEYILLMALLEPRDRSRLEAATADLLARMDNGKALIVQADGSPFEGEDCWAEGYAEHRTEHRTEQRLLVLGKELTWEEVAGIPYAATKFPAISRERYVAESWKSVLEVVKRAKGHARYRFQKTTNRHPLNKKRRELPLLNKNVADDLNEARVIGNQLGGGDMDHDAEGVMPNRDLFVADTGEPPGGLWWDEKQRPTEYQEIETIRETLSSLKRAARALGWRGDRIDNALKVAEYLMNHPSSCWKGKAAEALGMNRHTVGLRANDLCQLIGEGALSQLEEDDAG